jgi:hypothetical protein
MGWLKQGKKARGSTMDLDDVLLEYVSAFPDRPPNHAQMMEWVREYPEFGQDIAEFTIAWCQMEAASGRTEPLDPAFEEKLIESGLAVVKKILADKKLESKR